MPLRSIVQRALVPCFLLAAAAVHAQTPAAPAAVAPAASAASAPAPGAQQRIEITGGRASDVEQRRQSTAAKIVIGREEIDKFGDATVGEVLRRLPGITTPGAPGRGGPPRMRGLGSGYTQVLIDGQRLPPGFTLDSLTPEQIERIEILRAPTAETGARAIAGTINIITREGFQKRLNDWRIGTGVENGKPSFGSSWSHNDNVDNLTYTLSAGAYANQRANGNTSRTWVTSVADGKPLEERVTTSRSSGENQGLNLGARLQWRLGAAGDSLIVSPGLFANRGDNDARFQTRQLRSRPGSPEFADHGDVHTENSFLAPRLQLQYRQRVGEWRLEGGGTLRASRSHNLTFRDERRADDSSLRSQQDDNLSRESGLQLNAKGSRLLGGEGSEHSLVLGLEAEGSRRNDTTSTLVNGKDDPALADIADQFEASTLRLAAYAQDEWALNQHWSFHAGLRWEGITTRGDDGIGGHPENRNSVTTPLLHLLWKPDPDVRDQVRLSLTRSWRAPATATLIGRPSINRFQPPPEPNTEPYPDRAGNPDLKPELATGIDLAFERYLEGGGLLSANFFVRRISDLMRSVVALEDNVPWGEGQPRWVRRTRNIGNATARGIELEAKFRLDQLIAGALPVELRANLGLFGSQVDGVPGPDNRLDQQSKATGNLGADYRLRGTPLTLGGNINWVPETLTRLAADETTRTTTKRQWDMFALWTFTPTVGLRLMANNLLPRDYATETFNDASGPSGVEQTRNVSGGPSYVNWQLRLELKL